MFSLPWITKELTSPISYLQCKVCHSRSSAYFRGLKHSSQERRSGIVKGRLRGCPPDPKCKRSNRLVSPHLIPLLPFANAFTLVKFKDPATALECDINVNDQLGFINTSLIRHYVSMQPVLIPLLRLMKRWAKTVGMNSPSKWPVSFSSYALTLMTIAWFQVMSLMRRFYSR